MSTHVIVGAGQAGGQAARAMRECGFDGRIVLIGSEPHPPYQRPPLSKAVLLGKSPPERTHLFKGEWLSDNRVELMSDTTVVEIDAGSHEVVLDDGTRIGWDKLLLATGARLRQLQVPGADAEGVHYLRGIDDTLALRAELLPERRVVVIGGGFIGLEVAAAASELGCSVQVVEAAERLMGRAMEPWFSDYFAAVHAEHGVDIHLDTAVSELRGEPRVNEVVCGARVFPADAVVVGIGILPQDQLARAIGIDCDNGILVDEHGETSMAGVYACGDVACHHNSRFGARIRLESWENAQNQAVVAAVNMCGERRSYDPAPWFWTHQYDRNLQMAGLPPSWESRVMRGSPDDGPFSVWYFDADRLVACNAVNCPRDLRVARKLIETGTVVDAARIADPDTDLKSLMPQESG